MDARTLLRDRVLECWAEVWTAAKADPENATHVRPLADLESLLATHFRISDPKAAWRRMTREPLPEPELPKIDVRRCGHCGELPFVEVVRDRAETAVVEPGRLAS